MLMSPAPPTNRPVPMMPPTILEYSLRFAFNVVHFHNKTLKIYDINDISFFFCLVDALCFCSLFLFVFLGDPQCV